MFSILDNIGAFEHFTGQTLSALLGIVRGWSPYGGSQHICVQPVVLRNFVTHALTA
ncbi:hypothetical protein K7G19_02790 [Cupriavidus sp. DB3]|uniref:hypothetical protein n=1 Tax=Cupriavidus sp. DB3 TaxID=2873259 RepID=UPI001CF4A6E0|nr:hypothetical protein [Cupriavidus sp. DB3]MCA7082525.1 hypothetical protein [Cupriavidus sp. DB3]